MVRIKQTARKSTGGRAPRPLHFLRDPVSSSSNEVEGSSDTLIQSNSATSSPNDFTSEIVQENGLHITHGFGARDEIGIKKGEEEADSVAHTGTTPLPWLQLLMIIFMRLSDPINSSFIFPFINDLIWQLDLTKDRAKLGLYAGILEFLFAVSQTITILGWARLSDKYGRKPILIFGLIGSSIGAIGIGLMSSSFTALIISRCSAGALNGNVAVYAAMIGEMSDKTNEGRAFSLFSAAFPFGLVLGPMLGAYLSKPAEKYTIFSSKSHGILSFGGVWESFPFLLPCLAVASYSWTATLVSFFALKETLPSKVKKVNKDIGHVNECTPLLQCPQEPYREPFSNQANVQTKSNYEISFRELVQHSQILLRIISSCFLGLCMISLDTVDILYFWEPVKIGGLSFSSNTTDSLLKLGGAWGVMSLLFFFPHFQKRLGTLTLFQICISGFALISIIMPIASFVARSCLVDPIKGGSEHGKFEQDLTPFSQQLILTIAAIALFIKSSCAMAYPCIAILMNQAANIVPGQHRATLNGLSQISFSAMNAVGPYTFSTIYALTLHDQVLGGYLIWMLIAGTSMVGIYISFKLTELHQKS